MINRTAIRDGMAILKTAGVNSEDAGFRIDGSALRPLGAVIRITVLKL